MSPIHRTPSVSTPFRRPAWGLSRHHASALSRSAWQPARSLAMERPGSRPDPRTQPDLSALISWPPAPASFGTLARTVRAPGPQPPLAKLRGRLGGVADRQEQRLRGLVLADERRRSGRQGLLAAGRVVVQAEGHDGALGQIGRA